MLADIIALLSTVSIGLLAGSLLLEGAIFIPYWRRMDPSEFFRLHGTLGPHLFTYFAPLTTATVVLSVVAAALALDEPAHIVAAILCLALLAIFFVYFRKANASFADGSLSEDDLAAELKRWNAWHWVRTWLLLVAFVLSVLS
ncbi:MAG: DUF1772 domain-containing protein [Parvularculaceae bacterium]|nr:DUF1772 domain-containing protein [Parvularculaceae bacterium]